MQPYSCKRACKRARRERNAYIRANSDAAGQQQHPRPSVNRFLSHKNARDRCNQQYRSLPNVADCRHSTLGCRQQPAQMAAHGHVLQYTNMQTRTRACHLDGSHCQYAHLCMHACKRRRDWRMPDGQQAGVLGPSRSSRCRGAHGRVEQPCCLRHSLGAVCSLLPPLRLISAPSSYCAIAEDRLPQSLTSAEEPLEEKVDTEEPDEASQPSSASTTGSLCSSLNGLSNPNGTRRRWWRCAERRRRDGGGDRRAMRLGCLHASWRCVGARG